MTTKTKIIILTGPIRSGKTTFLKSIFENTAHCGGFLTPDRFGKRVFFRLDTQSYHEFETENHDDIRTISVGPFIFSKATFRLGNELIMNILNSKYEFFIIDEIGKLELKDQGFGIALNNLFLEDKIIGPKALILVIRDSLLKDVLMKYKITSPDIIDIQDSNFKEKFTAACGIV